MACARRRTMLAVMVILVSTTMALAASDAGGDPVHVDYWQAGFTIVVFVGLVFLLSKFAFRPIVDALKAREEFIHKSLRDADEANKQAQRLFADYTAQLDKARAEASAIVEEGRRDAEVVKRSIQDETRKEAEAMIARAKREIGVARDTAVRELYDVGAKLATDVAGKIVSRELNPADHERLIKESITELSKVSASSN